MAAPTTNSLSLSEGPSEGGAFQFSPIQYPKPGPPMKLILNPPYAADAVSWVHRFLSLLARAIRLLSSHDTKFLLAAPASRGGERGPLRVPRDLDAILQAGIGHIQPTRQLRDTPFSQLSQAPNLSRMFGAFSHDISDQEVDSVISISIISKEHLLPQRFRFFRIRCGIWFGGLSHRRG